VDEQGAQVGLLVRPEMGAIAGLITVWSFFAIIVGNSGFLTLIRRNA